MHKLLISLLGAGILAACSSTNPPSQPQMASGDCSNVKAQVKTNHAKIAHAFAHRDANTIGTLELQNRDIVHANMKCFPNLEKQIKYWQNVHKNMTN